MMNINENVAYAKSILNKNNITPDLEEYKDFLKIREICGSNHGYVGILTKIRFVDNITDMNEISSIFDLLKNSKIDVTKLNKMSYDDILEIFYDELSNDKEKNKDIELIYKDATYSYYRVYTYEGILQIGSPAWCLKTKSNWDEYQIKYKEQWVVIDNRYKGKLINAGNNYLSEYKSNKGYIRYGFSLNDIENNKVNWIGFSDNNQNIDGYPKNCTSFGVLCTIMNLRNNINKSYYNSFIGCEEYEEKYTILKVINKEKAFERLGLKNPKNIFDEYDEFYLGLSKSYSNIPLIFCLNDKFPICFYTTSKVSNKLPKYFNIEENVVKFIDEYASKSNSPIYYGINIKNKKMTLDDIKNNNNYITKINKWLIFNNNDNYYLIVNSEPKDYQLPIKTEVQDSYLLTDPFFYYLDKKTLKIFKNPNLQCEKEIIDYLFNNKKVKGFWDFLKK